MPGSQLDPPGSASGVESLGSDEIEDAKARRALHEDTQELRRGVIVNSLGYLVKLAHPLLLVLVVREYGAAAFGVFTAANAALLLALRLCLLGFDKGTLWMVSRSTVATERRGIVGVLWLSLGASSLSVILLTSMGLGWAARWAGDPSARLALGIMSLGLVPMALSEVLVAACLGKRRMEAQVYVKEGVVPIGLVLSALIFHHVPGNLLGLALAFIVSQLGGLAAAAILFGRVFAGSNWGEAERTIPRQVVRYSLPMGLSEVSNSLYQRMDLLFITAISSPSLVGVYAAVTQIGNSVRAIRRSFDPIVLALFSKIGVRPDRSRLTAVFSYATALVVSTQMPVFAFILVFSPWLLGLFGAGFEQGTSAAWALCAFWIVNGAIGLNGAIVSGMGRSDWILFDVLLSVGVQAILLLWWVPRFGLVGAACAVGASYSIQNLVQLFQAKRVNGFLSYDQRVLAALSRAALAFAGMAAAWLLLGATPVLVQRVGSFLVFVLIQLPALYRAWRGWAPAGLRPRQDLA